jgi:hypothetical protein
MPDNLFRLRNFPLFSIEVLILLFILNGCANKENRTKQLNQDMGNSKELYVGVARENITPPVGMRLCGTFEERLATGVHDSLYVRAFVFQQGETKIAIAGCDLAMVFPEICDSVRARIKKLGFSSTHVLIHGSETHNGPDYYGEFRDVFHEKAVAEKGKDPAEPIDYNRLLIEKISNAIRRASNLSMPAEIYFSSGKCSGIAFNRRFRMKDGSVGWNPGKMNPGIVEPLGPVDEFVPVLSVYQGDRKVPAAVITGYAMHLAILDDTLYGADYPYYLEQKLKNEISPELFTHFLQSPCCEVNHINVHTSEPQKGRPWAKVVGETLADSVLGILEKPMTPLDPDLKVKSIYMSIDLQEYTSRETETQREIWHSPKRINMHFLDVVYAGKVAAITDRHNGGPVRCLLQAFQIDNQTVILGLPSEVSVELGLFIKEHSPYKNTMIVQLSNDWFGYIPTKKIFNEGHYEAVVAKIRPGEGERMAHTAVEMLNKLKLQ